MQTCIWPSGFHCHSLSLASVKSSLVLPFWYQLTWVVLDNGPLNGCVCVCVYVCPIDGAQGIMFLDCTSICAYCIRASMPASVWRHYPDSDLARSLNIIFVCIVCQKFFQVNAVDCSKQYYIHFGVGHL